MRKNKGFTLIELLAVIVVFIAIALITVPIVLKLVENSKQGAAVASAYAYIDAVENYSISAEINGNMKLAANTKYYVISNSSYQTTRILEGNIYLNNVIEVKGSKPNDGYIIMENDVENIKEAKFLYGNIEVECDENRCWESGKKEVGEPTTEKDELVWDGWITLKLNYPENAVEKKWRVGSAGEVREEDWNDYGGSITIPLSELEKIYIKYKLGEKVVVIPPKGEIYVDIEPSSYTIKEGGKVSFIINATEGSEVYYKIGSEWIKYEGEVNITESGVIEAKAVKDENVYLSDGSVAYTRKITVYDGVYIRDYSEESEVPRNPDNGGIIPSYYEQGPTITVSPTERSEEVTVSLTTPKTARKIYVKKGTNEYQEYTGQFTINSNIKIYAYYITEEEGITSSETIYTINNIYRKGVKNDGEVCDLPYLTFSTNPSLNYKYAKAVEVTLNYDEGSEVYYSYNKVDWTEYKGTISIKENKRIYGKTVNGCGETVEYIDITNIGERGVLPNPPTPKEELSIDITVLPEPSVSNEYVTSAEVTITYDKNATSKKYRIGNGPIQTYEGSFEVSENEIIYAYASSGNGYGEARKKIDNIGIKDPNTGAVTSIGLSSPNIVVSPSNVSAQEVEITIDYDKNATVKQYKIGTGNWNTYTVPFQVSENEIIYAMARNGSLTKTSSYGVTNIQRKMPIYVLNKENYYLIKLNYPTQAKSKEYKYTENGIWKSYKEDGILLLTSAANINTNGIIKIEDENGVEIEFNGDYYYIETSPSEIMSDIYIRWDTSAPSTPLILKDNEEATKEVNVTILYDDSSVLKEYKIVNPDGTTKGWVEYTGPIKVTRKNTIIYARSMNGSEVYSKEQVSKIENIDEQAPIIKLSADFETTSNKLNIKVNITDDVKVETVMYTKGIVGASYFKTGGEVINNNSIVTILENGEYTFYAKDSVGNEQIYTILIENIDNVPPRIEIEATPSTEVGIETTINIDYGEATEQKYKIGKNTTTWTNYTEAFVLTSETVLSQNLQNSDYSVTICAQAKDNVGNTEEVCEKIYNLDLDAPSTPIINTNSGYPTLTLYGVTYNNSTTIYYGNRNDVDNYYSYDGNTWIKYTGKFEATGTTIYAKSVKKDTGLTTMTSLTINKPSDALGPLAYDDGENKNTTYEKFIEGKSYKIYVDDTVVGHDIIYTYRQGHNNNKLAVNIYKTTGETESTVHTGNANIKDVTISVTEPIKYIEFIFQKKYITSGDVIYDINIDDTPKINVKTVYPTLTLYGVRDGYNQVTIDYFKTSVQKLYKIDDGEWLNYTGPIIPPYGSTIYVKGIDQFGRETELVSYSSVVPSDALGPLAYDDGENRRTTYEQLTLLQSYKIYVDDTVVGHDITYTYRQGRSQNKLAVNIYKATGETESTVYQGDANINDVTISVTEPIKYIEFIFQKKYITSGDVIYDIYVTDTQ